MPSLSVLCVGGMGRVREMRGRVMCCLLLCVVYEYFYVLCIFMCCVFLCAFVLCVIMCSVMWIELCLWCCFLCYDVLYCVSDVESHYKKKGISVHTTALR